MKCGDVMLSYVYSCRAGDSATRCAGVMRDANVGFLPVLDAADKVIGVVTDRDLAVRLVAEELPLSTPVEKLMSRGELLVFSPDDELAQVESRMAQHKKSRALVVDGEGRCQGVLSLSDIAQAEDPSHVGRLLREVTRREAVVLIHPSH